MTLKTLGGLTLEDTNFTGRKPLLLLAYLALEGPKSRRYLAELFWMGATDPRNNLGTALSRLRGVAPGIIEADRERAWTSVACDAKEFLTAIEQGAPDRALELYEGPFLDGVDVADPGVELEEWIFATREHLAAHARRARILLGEAAAARGEFDLAARHAERAYRLQQAPPANPEELERIHLLLVAGNSARASELLEDAEPYGLTFEITEREARRRFSGASPDSGSTTEHNLSSAGTSFVGRDRILGELLGFLAEADRRLVTLLGAAGVGKTRLALQAAHASLARGMFEDGIYFVRLEALADPAAIPVQIADAIGVRLRGVVDPLQRVARSVGGKRMLLVLDNYEHLIEGASLAAELVQRCPRLVLLVTSRERLNLAVESIYPLRGLALSHESDASEEPRLSEAVRLFVERARSADLRYVPTPESLPEVLEICRLVDGSPLGIELAAVWVRVMSPAEIAREIERNLDFLATSVRDVPERHRSLRAAFESSWNLLPRNERAVLWKSSVFRGGFRRDAASEVAGASIPVLASLVDKSFLRLAPNGRYDRHPLLLQFTRDKLAEHPREAARARDDHGGYFTRFMERWGEELRGARHEGAARRIEEEHENVRAAWWWAVERRRMVELKLFAILLPHFYEERYRFREGADLIARTVADLTDDERVDDAVLGHLLVGEAALRRRFGQEDRSLELAGRGVDLLRARGEARGMIRGLRSLTLVHWTLGNFERARTFGEEAVALARRDRNPMEIATCLRFLGWVMFSTGDYRAAEAHATEALSIHQALDDATGVAFDLQPLGLAVLGSGRPEEAEAHFRTALRFARNSGVKETEASCLGHLGRALLLSGEVAEAERCLLERLRLSAESEDLHLQAWTRIDLGRVLTVAGELARAERQLLKGVEIAVGSRSALPLLAVLGNLAALRTRQNRCEEAVALASLLVQSPSCEHDVKRSAEQLLEELRERLPDDAFLRAEARGRSSNAAALGAEVLQRGSSGSAGG